MYRGTGNTPKTAQKGVIKGGVPQVLFGATIEGIYTTRDP